MNNSYKAIFIDLGNVMIDFDHMIAVRKIVKFSRLKEKEILQIVFDSDLTCLFEEGKISETDFYKMAKEKLKFEMTYGMFLPIWNEIFFFTPRNKFVHQMVCKLRKNYRTFLISNVNKLHFEYIKNTFNILDCFDGLLLSYEVGARKPNPIIYNKAIQAAGCRADEIIYFDDREDLIKEASRLGIESCQFTDIESFKKTLEGLGVLN